MKQVLLSICMAAFIALHGLSQAPELTKDQQEELQGLYNTAREQFKEKQYKEAAESYVKAFTIGKNKYAAFNAARAYSLISDSGKVAVYAQMAYNAGILNFDDEKDFDNVRQTKGFMAVADKAGKELEAMKKQPIRPTIIFPADYDKAKQYPIIFYMHGYGSSPIKSLKIYEAVAHEKKCILYLPRGSEVLGRNSYGWTFKPEELERLHNEFTRAIEKLNAKRDRIVLSGFSQGGSLTYLLGIKHADLFCGLLPVAGTFPEEVDVKTIANKKLKVFSIVGTKDRKEYLEQNQRAEKLLTGMGLEFKLNQFDIGHAFPDEHTKVLSQGVDWFFGKE